MRAANALLEALPEGHRTQRDGQIKRRVVRPSRLSMRLDDPSEAVESSRLMPALHRHFAILEDHPYGGILHLALHGIAHNFLAEDDPATAAARGCACPPKTRLWSASGTTSPMPSAPPWLPVRT